MFPEPAEQRPGMSLRLRGDENRVVSGNRAKHISRTNPVKFYSQGVGVPRPRPENDGCATGHGLEQLSSHGLPEAVLVGRGPCCWRWKGIAIGALYDAEGPQIAGKGRLGDLDPLARQQLLQLLLAGNIVVTDQIEDLLMSSGPGHGVYLYGHTHNYVKNRLWKILPAMRGRARLRPLPRA